MRVVKIKTESERDLKIGRRGTKKEKSEPGGIEKKRRARYNDEIPKRASRERMHEAQQRCWNHLNLINGWFF